MSEIHEIDGNELTLLQNGTAYFARLCADIDAARCYIYLETYIFSADKAGHAVSLALRRAAGRGLVVRVLLDGFGSGDLPEPWLEEMRMSGVQVHMFRRELYRFKLRRHRLRRLHRKLVVLDGEIAYLGGINITDDTIQNGPYAAPRFDFAVRVQGGIAGEVYGVMRRLWIAASWARGMRMERFITPRLRVCPNIRVVLRDNLRHRRDIERAYLKAIFDAKHEVMIANAYFLPGRIFRRALIQASRRGVRVVLLLQGRVEHRLLHYATQALYQQLLAAGIEIYEYQASFLHAKVAVVDGLWATVGSSNIDPFSLLLAREANLAVRDTGFAADLHEKLLLAISQDARRIESDHWHRQAWYLRLAARLSYAIIRMLAGSLGYSRRVD